MFGVTLIVVIKETLFLTCTQSEARAAVCSLVVYVSKISSQLASSSTH